MVEVTVFESGLEVGTFDFNESDIEVGNLLSEDMKVIKVTPNPPSGEDYLVEVEYV